MKMTLKVATILTWFNLIFWGLVDSLFILMSAVSLNLPVLAGAVLISAIPLNCYAALKLQASIRHPAVPLSSQTPVGIRFVGFIALFFGINWLGDGYAFLKNTNEFMQFIKDQLAQLPQVTQQFPQLKTIGPADIRQAGVFCLFLGLCVIINVVLNLRLLRWYYLVKKSDVSSESDESPRR
jgi:hypothetical protein